MHRFERNLITEWRRLKLPTDESVVVAVSGGADSVALLLGFVNLLERKKFSGHLMAAHLDHGLRGKESEGDREAVRALSEQLGIDFVYERAKIEKKGNLEQNARNARYKFLENIAHNYGSSIIVTGHTMNDQAETLLMNLVRGCGPDGLAAMPAVKTILASSEVRLVRPLLLWATRKDTENYCKEMGYEFRVDSMNLDPAFRRVRIRREVLPLLAELNPKIIQTLAATSQLFSTTETPNIQQHLDDELSISTLREIDPRERLDTIRAWLAGKRGTKRRLALKHIQAVERLALSEKSGRVAELPGKAHVVRAIGRLRYVEN